MQIERSVRKAFLMFYYLVMLNFVINAYIFGVHDCSMIGAVLTVICLVGAMAFYRKRKVNYKDPLVIAILLIIIEIIGQALRNLTEGMDGETILLRMQPLYVFIYLLPLIIVLDSQTKIRQFIQLINISAVLSAIFSIIQFITQISTSGSTVKYDAQTGFDRVYHPDAYLMGVSLFIIISEILLKRFDQKKINKNYMFAIIIVIGMLTTLHRNLFGVTFMGFILIALSILFTEKGKNVSKVAKSIIICIVLLFIGVSAAGHFGISSATISERALSGVSDIANNEGNYLLRFTLISSRFYDVWNESPLFGRGFNFIPHSEEIYLQFVPFSTTADTDYGNIAIIFGFPIFLILLFLYYHIQKRALYNFKVMNDPQAQSIALASIPIPLFFIIIGIFAPTSTEPPFLNPLISMIALLVVSSENKNIFIHV
jgi:hypothetical protein